MSEDDRAKWDSRYSKTAPSSEPSPWLLSWLERGFENIIPKSGRVLDVAGGAGRNAIWFAQRGYDVTLIDISPVAIELAEQRAKEAGVTLTARVMDLENEALPDGPWDIIVQMHYLERGLFSQYMTTLAPAGLLFVEHPTRTNLKRHEKPSAKYLLEDGELPELCEEFVMVTYGEGWNEAGKYEARLVARRLAEE
jgi:2-polyprenyl-3-methyl-5-hydroxy-6-metoxy-1,4-benzoquinol methylase